MNVSYLSFLLSLRERKREKEIQVQVAFLSSSSSSRRPSTTPSSVHNFISLSLLAMTSPPPLHSFLLMSAPKKLVSQLKVSRLQAAAIARYKREKEEATTGILLTIE
jgi:hypothetical protein